MKNSWSYVRLGDICNIKHGFAFKGEYFVDEETRNILLTPGNFQIGGGFKSNKYKYYNGEVPAEYVLSPDDLIVTMTDLSKSGDTLGYSALIPNDNVHNFLHNQRIGKVEIVSNSILKKFLYWIMRTSIYQKYIVSRASGSTVKHTSPTSITSYSFLLPPLPTQRAIAATLSCLDDKIELNNRINANLEAQAQAIFKSWFVDFELFQDGKFVDNELGRIPEGWKTLSLGEYADVIDDRGKTPALSQNNTSYPIIDVKALSGNSRALDYNNCTKFVDENTYNTFFRNGHPKPNDILLSTVGSLATIKLFLGNIGCMAQNVVAFRSKQYSPLFLYQYLLNIQNKLISYDIGSVQPSIKVTHIIKHPVLVPCKEYLDKFQKISNDITMKIYSNSLENHTLAAIRDALLLKLMSGEIEVEAE
jgi:type I restriction enzyme S subunit